MATSRQDIYQLLTCVSVEFTLTLDRETATEPWKIWRRNQIAAAAHQFQAWNTAANLHFYVQVLPKLDFREDFEKYRKKLLQPWNFHSIYTRCSETIERRLSSHLSGRNPAISIFFYRFPPKEEQGDIDKILELWNILCVGKTNNF